MGSTYVDFDGRGFDAKDVIIGLWLSLLVDEIDLLSEVPGWLKEARDEWDIHATHEFNFGVMTCLDRFLTDAHKRDAIISLCERVNERLAGYGESMSAEELNSISHMDERDGRFVGTLPKTMLTDFGRDLMDLLRGRDFCAIGEG
jgi:hypothetical protein